MRIFKKTIQFMLILAIICHLPGAIAMAEKKPPSISLSPAEIAAALGWVQTGENRCGGYYLEPALSTQQDLLNPETIDIVSNQLFFSFHGTSEIRGKITIRRYGQEITANKAYLYRNPKTDKLNAIDLLGHVTLREPNTLILAKNGRFDRETKTASLQNAFYRTAIYSDSSKWKTAKHAPNQLKNKRKIYQLSAWGEATSFEQIRPRLYSLTDVSYTTCPPTQSFWKLKASHVDLDKESGRGVAYHARVSLHGIPILYTPVLSFPIDHRRKTGFLWPTAGVNSNNGPYFTAPYYWNMAPNYDMTITPGILTKRGIQLNDTFRYLTPESSGQVKVAVLPNDKAFGDFQNAAHPAPDSVTQAELRRLLNASTTRKSFIWKNNTRFNEHWFGTIDYNYVSDDYYLRDLNSSVNEVTQNQLLQQAEINYKGRIWNFTGRTQGYQTLHPVDVPTVFNNQYTRFPQLILGGNYSDTLIGMTYSINNEFTHFDIRNTPGTSVKMPMGNRMNVQPAISRPFNTPYFFIEPRLQLPMTKYEIGHVANNQPKSPDRILPVFDLSSGLYFDRHFQLLDTAFTQTLEPQIYYTYIPFRNQNQLPVFDTTVNQLTYDQLFTYNRFSGIDRINDANQVSVGLTTRFIDQKSGAEKIRVGLGQIFYFRHRLVTLCSDVTSCTDNPLTPENRRSRSPLSGLLKYHLNPNWSAEANSIWNTKSNELLNQTLTVQYKPADNRIINFSYTFVRNGDNDFPSQKIDKASNNLSQTDISAAWPIFRDWNIVGRWTQNLNRHNFQNLLSGVQYDACCWAVRLVAGREFIGLNLNNTPKYNTEFYIQFALKGLGNFGSGDPTQLLVNSVSGYQTQFGQDF